MRPYFAVQWHITDVCDQRCKHCYIFAEGHPALLSAPWSELLHTYAQIRALCGKLGRAPYIYLTGGDPILHPDFWRLLELFKADGTRFCIMGNPFHLTDETCARMKACGCVKYQLSLDGLEKTHDMFRKPGSFRATLNAIPKIRRAGMWCALMSTVSKTNMDEIPALIDLADEAGADVYAVGRYCPTSREKAYDADIHIPPREYRAFLECCWEKYEAHRDSKTTFQLKDHLWALFLYEKGLLKLPAGEGIADGCNCGRNHITILPNGGVYACRRMESKVGNVTETDLYGIWTGAGGRQGTMIVAVRDRALTERLGRLNLARFDRSRLLGSYVSKEQPSVIDDASIRSGFYGAPSVCAIFAPKNFLFSIPDAFCAAENMVLQATELGIGSCIVSRAEETFAGEEGQQFLRAWKVPEDYIVRCFVILGYCDGPYPAPKPRRAGRSLIVGE